MGMGLWDMIIIVTVVGCLSGVIIEYFKSKRDGSASSDADEAFDRIEELEERIRVLEKVVTDDRYNLDREIDRLQR